MTRSILPIGLCLLLTACGGSDNSGRATATAPAFSESSASSDDEKDVLHQMPDGDQIEEAYEAILEKAGVDDPELLEIEVDFSRDLDTPSRDDSNLSLKLVSPKDKNKILFYRYDFPEKKVREPEEVTLTMGIGSTEKFIDTYDGFKASLFKKSDIMDFDKADDVYKETIDKSTYGADKCYVSNLHFMYFPTGLSGRVSVQSTRSGSASKSFLVDKSGNATLY